MPPPATLPQPDALREVARSLAGIGMLLKRGVEMSVGRGPRTPMQTATFWRINRLLSRLHTILFLLARGEAPRVYPPRPRRPEPDTSEGTDAPPQTDPPPPPERPRPLRLPRRPGWLMGRAGDINAAASQLRHWLAQPDTRAVLEAVPQFRAPLAALCRMLLIAPWPGDPHQDFPRPPPRKRKPRPPKPKRETLAECRAWCIANYRNSEIDAGLVKPGKRPWWMPPRGYKRR